MVRLLDAVAKMDGLRWREVSFRDGLQNLTKSAGNRKRTTRAALQFLQCQWLEPDRGAAGL
jgi:hypothetical protein